MREGRKLTPIGPKEQLLKHHPESSTFLSSHGVKVFWQVFTGVSIINGIVGYSLAWLGPELTVRNIDA
jgi:hypothetical protein